MKRPISSSTAKARRNAESPRTYSGHRDRQRKRILAEAESLFLKAGIEAVSMLDIKEAVGIQPSTLYAYFKNKEELVWAVAESVLQSFSERASKRIQEHQTALGKVKALFMLMAEDLETRLQDVRFMAQFDILYARDLSVSRLLEMEAKLGVHGFHDLSTWVDLGITDGTFRSNLDRDVTLHAVFNAAIGTQRRVAALGEKVQQEYGPSATALFAETANVLLCGVAAEKKVSVRTFTKGAGKRRER